MGGRGASSSKGSNTYSEMIQERAKMPRVFNFEKGIDVIDKNAKGTSISTVRYKDLEKYTENLRETIVQIPLADINRGISRMNNLGYEVEKISKYDKDANKYTTRVLIKFKKRVV